LGTIEYDTLDDLPMKLFFLLNIFFFLSYNKLSFLLVLLFLFFSNMFSHMRNIYVLKRIFINMQIKFT
jgi:hypothetical protein